MHQGNSKLGSSRLVDSQPPGKPESLRLDEQTTTFLEKMCKIADILLGFIIYKVDLKSLDVSLEDEVRNLSELRMMYPAKRLLMEHFTGFGMTMQFDRFNNISEIKHFLHSILSKARKFKVFVNEDFHNLGLEEFEKPLFINLALKMCKVSIT